jgi:polysaccharide deactylase WbmS-like protein
VICLSFDTDHLDEGRMEEFLATVPIPGEGTFFCTRRYECLGPPHEVCPHPLLEEGGNWEEELAGTRGAFPAAVGWRSHSCIYSHLIAQRVAAAGYLYASTQLDPLPPARPFREAWGLWHMPIFYMDNLDFSQSRFWPGTTRVPFGEEIIERALADDGIYVFDFHPVHLTLNSASAAAYFERRDAFLAGEPLDALRCEGRGARTFYDELCARMERDGVRSVRMRDALAAWLDSEAGSAHGQSDLVS